MRTVVQSFSLGILTATTIIGFTFFMGNKDIAQGDSTQEATPALTVDTAKGYLEGEGYAVMTSTNFESLKLENKQLENEVQQLQSQLKEDEPKHNDIEESDSVEDEQEKQDQPQSESTESYTLVIESGMTSIDIANDLSDAGIISDAEEFNQFLEEQNYSRAIQLGEYKVNTEQTYEEIAQIITN